VIKIKKRTKALTLKISIVASAIIFLAAGIFLFSKGYNFAELFERLVFWCFCVAGFALILAIILFILNKLDKKSRILKFKK